MEWYRLTKEELFSNLESDEDGLDAISRQERLAKEGPNELSKGEEISEIRKFLSHFNDLLVYALIVSAALMTSGSQIISFGDNPALFPAY